MMVTCLSLQSRLLILKVSKLAMPSIHTFILFVATGSIRTLVYSDFPDAAAYAFRYFEAFGIDVIDSFLQSLKKAKTRILMVKLILISKSGQSLYHVV